MIGDRPLVTLRFYVHDVAELYEAAVLAYGPTDDPDHVSEWLSNDDGTPNLARCLTEVLCEQAMGSNSKLDGHADLWEPAN